MSGVEFAVMVLAIAIGLLARWWTYRKPSRQRSESDAGPQPFVGVVVRGPVMPVPDLMDAYGALPPHCHGGSDR